MALTLLGFLALVGLTFMKDFPKPGKPQPQPQPVDPAAVRLRVWQAIQATELEGMKPQLLLTVGRVETGNFKSSAFQLTKSLFNRHKGSGRGFWTGKVYYTTGGEDLRVYESYEQCVRDFVQLMQDPLYIDAYLAAVAGDSGRFFEALAKGDGNVGYVGPSNTAKARNYVAALKRTHLEAYT